ncbi:MAG: ABC transporter substrate-binding protein [Dehalococcoidia bacterium]
MSKRLSKMGWIVLAALLCLSLIALPACTTPLAEQEEEEEPGITIPFNNPGTFVFQTIGPIKTLDPAWIYDTASAQQTGCIYETLLYFDREKSDEFVPILATDWEFNSTDLTFTFTIREGVKFHSGNDLTPEDVEYTYERWMVQDRTGGPAWMIYGPLLDAGSSADVTFADIAGAVDVDGDSVVFHLSGGAHWELAFLQILCGGWSGIVDKEFCIANGGWDGTEATWMDYNIPDDVGDTVLYNQSSGTGPWKLNLWEPGIQVKLEKNDDYWGGSVPFDYVITQVVEEWTSRKLALLAGDADLVYVPATFFDEMDDIEDETEDLQVYKDLPSLSIDAFFFNQDIAPESTFVGSGALDGQGIPLDFFTDLDVRKGFCYAFDFETYIRDGLDGQGIQRGSPVVEGLPFFDSGTSLYSKDLDKAEEHFKAAWGGQVWEKGFKMTLLYNSGNIPRKTACEILAEGLYGMNPLFQVSIQPISWPTFLGKIWGTRDMPMFQIGWLPDYPHPDNFVVPFMHSTHGAFSAYIGYGSPELDAKLKVAFEETDPVAQQALYTELQELCYEDPYGITLAQPIARRYFTKYIGGFYYNPVESSYPGRFIDMTKSES